MKYQKYLEEYGFVESKSGTPGMELDRSSQVGPDWVKVQDCGAVLIKGFSNYSQASLVCKVKSEEELGAVMELLRIVKKPQIADVFRKYGVKVDSTGPFTNDINFDSKSGILSSFKFPFVAKICEVKSIEQAELLCKGLGLKEKS